MPDSSHRNTINHGRDLHAPWCREKQFVIFSAVQRLRQCRSGMHRQSRGIHFSRQLRLFAEVRQVGRKPITQINGRSRRAPSHQPLPLFEARLWKEMRLQLRADSSRNPACRNRLAPALWLLLKQSQSHRSSPKLAGHVQQVARTRAAAKQSPSTRHCPHQHNIRQSHWRLSQVSASQRRPRCTRKFQQSIEESIHPRSLTCRCRRQFRRQSKGKERSQRPSSHRCHVAQTSRQHTVPNRLGRMPLSSEVTPIDRKVGRDAQLFVWSGLQEGAIVANPESQPKPRLPPDAPPDRSQQGKLAPSAQPVWS